MTASSEETRKNGPLAGVRIVDMSTVVLGPFATMILGDLGAEIIKVEAGSGDIMRHAGPTPVPGMGPIFTTLNRNKQSVVIDAKSDEGKAALTELLKTADVFFHNVRMAGMDRLGFGYDAVKAIKPDIVYVHCAGYGAGGPYETRQAYDDLIQVASGFAELNQLRDGGDPAYVPSLVADKTVGLFAVYATLAGMYHHARTGEGQFIQVPMLESFTFFHLVENLYGECWMPGNGKMAYTRSVNPRRKPYATQDGYIGIVPYSDDQWRQFFEIGERPGVFDDPRFADYKSRTENVAELYALIEEVAATKTTDEWLELLSEAQIPAMRFNKGADVLKDPHLTAVEFFTERQHASGAAYRSMKHPVSFSNTPASIRTDPKSLGADTEIVLQSLGL